MQSGHGLRLPMKRQESPNRSRVEFVAVNDKALKKPYGRSFLKYTFAVAATIFLARAELVKCIVSGLIAYYLHRSINKRIVSESVYVIEALGVQYATTRTDGTCEENFLSWEEIERVLILEAPFRMQFIFYLALQRRNPPDPKNPLIVLYPNLLPRLHEIKPVYQEIKLYVKDQIERCYTEP